MSALGDDWQKHAESIGPELAVLGTHAERVALLMGCAVVFARAAGMTEEQFREMAQNSFQASAELVE